MRVEGVPSRRPFEVAGFTLIELIVALAIAGIALAVVPFSMYKLYESAQYRTAVRDVLAGLKTARGESARTGGPVPFTVDLETSSFDIAGERETRLPAGLEFGLIVAEREFDGQRGSIVFYPDGSSTGGSVTVRRDNGDGVRLRVDWLLGRVTQEPLE